MRQTTRLMANTAALFGRMGVTFILGLVITRLLVQELGEVDYGLLMTLGGSAALLQVLTNALNESTSRHLAYEVGREDFVQRHRLFSTAIGLYLLLAVAVVLIGQALMPALLAVLTIPSDRMQAAWWVYQFSLFGIAFGFAIAPYGGILQAHQLLTVSAVFAGLIQILRFAAALSLLILPWDLLITFAGLQVGASVTIGVVQVAFCTKRFPESRPSLAEFRVGELKRIGGFAGWWSLRVLANRLRQQGGVIILNIFFGPVVSAAYAIAWQVQLYLSNFTSAIRRVFQPAMVNAYAAGQLAQTHTMMLISSKYLTIALGLMAIPVFFEADTVFRLWLGNAPSYTVSLVRLMLVQQTLMRLTVGHGNALRAHGDIGWLVRWQVLFNLGALVASIAAFAFTNLPPWGFPALGIVSGLANASVAFVGVSRRMNLDPRVWVKGTVVPVLKVLSACVVVAAAAHFVLPAGIWRTLLVFAASTLVGVSLFWSVALAEWERRELRIHAKQLGQKVKKKIPGIGSCGA